MSQTLVLIFGPPAVGKMTVGRALESLTGIPLFHNHMTIDLVLPFFEFDSPPFTRLVRRFREQLFEEVAAHGKAGLIFTYVWAFDIPADVEFVARVKTTFETRGSRVGFVELWTDLETRLERSASPARLAAKPGTRDVAAARDRQREWERSFQLRPNGAFPFGDYLSIDTTEISPEDAAARIASHFELPLKPGA